MIEDRGLTVNDVWKFYLIDSFNLIYFFRLFEIKIFEVEYKFIVKIV